MEDRRLLKVSTPEGKRIIAEIRRVKDFVRIKVKFNKFVKEDNPPFSQNGAITIMCKRKNYQETIQKLTKYFESLFLKGLADEGIHSSIGTGNDSRRDKKQTESVTIGVDKGKGSDTSIHFSTRGNKSTESSRRETTSPKMDKVGDKNFVGEDKTRD